MESWRKGDTRAGNELIDRHARTVLRFFRRKLTHGAEDLTQRTFLAAVENKDRVTSAHGFRAYLLGIARYEYLRVLRRRQREAPVVPVRTLTSPSRAAGREEGVDRLLVALRRLPPDLQITLELHYWEEMTTKQIGAVLGVAPGTIKWRLARARQLLAETLETLPADRRPATADNLDRWIRSMRDIVATDE